MAGIDGILNRIKSCEPVDKDPYDLDPTELNDIPRVQQSLEASLEALEKGRDVLAAGTSRADCIDAYARLKLDREIHPLRQGPSPKEFELYYNV